MGITLFEIFMTLSLTTYIGIIFYLCFMFFKSNIKHKMRWCMCFCALAILLLNVYFSNEFLQIAINSKFDTFKSIDSLKNNSHYVLAIQTLEIFTLNIRNVLFGTGYNCLNIFFQDIYYYSIMKAHNYYLQYLVELGIVGFCLIIYYLRLIYKQGKLHNKSSELLFVMLLSMLSMNFTYDAFTRNYNIIFVVFSMLIFKNRI